MSDESRDDPNPLQGLIRPWFFPSFGLTVVVGVGIFWMTGMITESAVGGIVAILVPLFLGFMVLRPALSPSTDPVARALLVAGALLAVGVAAIPSFEARWLPRWLAWILSLVALALVAAGEVRCRRDSGAAIAAGVALGFGLVVSHDVTPGRAVVPALWAIVLGGVIGAPAAVVLRMALRRILLPAAPRG